MFLRKKYFNRILEELGLKLYSYGEIDITFPTGSATNRIKRLEGELNLLREQNKKLQTLIEYLGLEYKTECTEKLPTFIKKKGKK